MRSFHTTGLQFRERRLCPQQASPTCTAANVIPYKPQLHADSANSRHFSIKLTSSPSSSSSSSEAGNDFKFEFMFSSPSTHYRHAHCTITQYRVNNYIEFCTQSNLAYDFMGTTFSVKLATFHRFHETFDLKYTLQHK